VRRNFGRRFAAAAVAGVWLYHGAAAIGTAFVAGMNAGGLTFGRRHIPAPKTMIAENVAFLALAWLAAEEDARA
jgi:hypothetical protein